MSYLPEDPDERGGWGPFSLPPTHPFQPAFEAHDRLFASRDDGFFSRSRKDADEYLLRGMLNIARERKSSRLKAEAYLYYTLARAFGGLFW